MANEVKNIKDKIASILATHITGLRTSAVWPDQLNHPVLVVVGPTAVSYSQTLGSNDMDLEFDLVLLAAPIGDGYSRGQRAIDTYIEPTGTTSIKAVLEAHRTLEGAADDLWIDAVEGYGSLKDGAGVEHWGCTFKAKVMASY